MRAAKRKASRTRTPAGLRTAGIYFRQRRLRPSKPARAEELRRILEGLANLRERMSEARLADLDPPREAPEGFGSSWSWAGARLSISFGRAPGSRSRTLAAAFKAEPSDWAEFWGKALEAARRRAEDGTNFCPFSDFGYGGPDGPSADFLPIVSCHSIHRMGAADARRSKRRAGRPVPEWASAFDEVKAGWRSGFRAVRLRALAEGRFECWWEAACRNWVGALKDLGAVGVWSWAAAESMDEAAARGRLAAKSLDFVERWAIEAACAEGGAMPSVKAWT